MYVRTFLATLLGLVALTITGLATWLFPLVNHIHQQLNGQPLQDPRGTVEHQINTWLSFLPADNIERTQIVCFLIAAYLVVTSAITLIAIQMHQSRLRRQVNNSARERTMRLVTAQPQKSIWTPPVVKNRYWRESMLKETRPSA